MSNKKISELTAATTTNSTDETVLAVSGTSKKITMANLINGIVKYLTTSAKGLTGVNDSNDNEVVKFTGVASAVNEVTFTNAASGSSPTLSASGGDTNIDMALTGKGTGTVKLGAAGLKFPNADGSAGSVPTSNGSGVMTMRTISRSGVKTIAAGTASGDQTIAHGLGAIPGNIVFTCDHYMNFSSGGGGNGVVKSDGYYNGSGEGCIYQVWNGGSSATYSPSTPATSATKIGAYYDDQGTSSSNIVFMDVTSIDATNITFNLPSTVSADSALQIFWTAS